MKVCHRCQAPWAEPGNPGFNNTCATCGISLHACGNCVYFLRHGSVRCAIPDAPRVLDWQAANRCKHFEFQDISAAIVGAAASATPTASSARERWNQLFR